MLRIFGPGCQAKPIEAADCDSLPAEAIWIDLLNPTKEEEKLVEAMVGSIPTRAEMQEIEPSSRLYERKGALFMSAPVLFGISDGKPRLDAVGFVLSPDWLVTIRYIDPKPFQAFAEVAYATPEEVDNSRHALLGLLDAIVSRTADEFERAGNEIENISEQIFEVHAHRRRRDGEMRMEAVMMRIGRVQSLLARLRESAVGLTRMLAFLCNSDMLEGHETTSRHLDSLLSDNRALSDHASFLADNLSFLLEASLGLIGLEQNQVMKIFSVVAVVLMPPTLIAGIYGMNFRHMPELAEWWGYPAALVAMLASAVLPYWFARRKGWL